MTGRICDILAAVLLILSSLALAAWMYLLLFRGFFWKPERPSPAEAKEPAQWPAVVAVVPARNEASVIERTMTSLRRQDYPGEFSIVLVDDDSTDGTPSLAQQVAKGEGHALEVVRAGALPPGWTGKLWAMAQGARHASVALPGITYIWFTDADVDHDRSALRALVLQAESERLDLVSTMVLLHCASFWERLLIPAFVFFFRKLYPFRRVNRRETPTAAAAGGSMLLRARALDRSGGLERIRGELIDDCALARLIKAGGPIRLQLTTRSRSVRPYSFSAIWNMVRRSAYTQLNHSSLWLLLAVVGMAIIYIVPPVAVVLGTIAGQLLTAGLGALSWALMAFAYCPTVRVYRQPGLAALLLPLAALLYIFMTVDSARQHWQGRGGAWKGRVQSRS
jgi:hopene-associated glycosyltransferase HpnB